MSQITSPPSPSEVQLSASKARFVSLRWKLLLGFTLIFSAVFAAAFYWFYTFSTAKAIDRLKQDLRSTTLGAAEGVDVDQLLDLYRKGMRNKAGFSDDPRYQQQLQWFETVHSISPNVYPYSYILGKPEQNRRIGDRHPKVKTGELEIVYLVDSLWAFIPDRALVFLSSDHPSDASITAFTKGETVERDLYTDEWGSWISAYTPLRDDKGKIVGVLGADIEADYVFEVQKAIRDRVLISFLITYGTLFALVYLVSDIVTKPLNRLTAAAERIGEGDYEQDLTALSEGKSQDEISSLARVFEIMVNKVRKREENLKQQVAELKIEIDQVKRHKQVSEITESDFFQDLVVKARKMRSKPANSDPIPESIPSVESKIVEDRPNETA